MQRSQASSPASSTADQTLVQAVRVESLTELESRRRFQSLLRQYQYLGDWARTILPNLWLS